MTTYKPQSLNGIPRPILEGRNKRYLSVNTIFLSVTIQSWFKQAFRSYITRSKLTGPPNMGWQGKGDPDFTEGEPDENDRSWHQLKPYTYQIKNQVQEDGSYTEYLSRIKTPAARQVLNYISKIDYRETGTNIRTGRTLAAFYPPRRTESGKLLAGPDQDIKVQPLGFDVTFKIPEERKREVLFGDPHERPLFDDGVEEIWMREAIKEGLNAARSEYDRLKQRYDRLEKKK